jgi:hypothetical protein
MTMRFLAAAGAAATLVLVVLALVVHAADVQLPMATVAGAGTGLDDAAALDATDPTASSGLASSAAGAPVRHGRPGVSAVVADRALARAYAAAGLAEAGDTSALNHLDEVARDRLDEARALLADAPLVRRAGAAPTGVHAGGAGSSPSPAAAPNQPAGGLHLDLPAAVDPATALRETPNGPLLVAPGLWAKAGFDPDRQRQLVVTDGCNGGYAIAIYGQDFSTIRLDGGLVVPGRYYQVDGSSVITGASACTVDIRPLSAVTVYATAPARPPQSNG